MRLFEKFRELHSTYRQLSFYGSYEKLRSPRPFFLQRTTTMFVKSHEAADLFDFPRVMPPHDGFFNYLGLIGTMVSPSESDRPFLMTPDGFLSNRFLGNRSFRLISTFSFLHIVPFCTT
jgi:hypothetical protein